MFCRIGLFDAVFASNMAIQASTEAPMTTATELPAISPGVASQVIERAIEQVKKQGVNTETAGALFEDCWMLGFISGLATAAAADHFITNEIEVLGLTTRTVGELAGGGLSNKVIAHEKIIAASDNSEFQEGARQGQTDWTRDAARGRAT